MATAAERRAARASLKRQEKLHPTSPDVPKESPKPEERPASATRTSNLVTVACKVPNGLILRNHEMFDEAEPLFGGGYKTVRRSRPIGNPITIVGPSRAPGSDPDAKRVVGGYGLTFNVPRDDFERWMKDNADLDIVKLKLIFAHENVERVQDQARDQKMLRSGLEPLNVNGKKADGTYIDPRMPKRVKKFNPDDESTDIRGMA